MRYPVAEPPRAPDDPRARRRRFWRRVLLVPVVVWALLAFTSAGDWLDREVRAAIVARGGTPEPGLTANLVSLVTRAWPAQWSAARAKPRLESLWLDVKFLDYQVLLRERAEALARGMVLPTEKTQVNAEVRHGSKTYKVDVRLKGDLVDHLDTEKWSVRIKVDAGLAILGMSEFSLQHPKTKGWQGEALFLAHARREGLLAPRYYFVDYVRNGDRLGVMALEEQFTTELLESQGRRDGVILKLDEDLRWRAAAMLRLDVNFSAEYPLVEAFQAQRVAAEPKLRADRQLATGLLRGFLEGRLPATEVFDAESWGRYLALCEVWGVYHALAWTNLRFYFNPITTRLEPIAFDANVHELAFQRVPTALIAVDRRTDRVCADMLEDPALRAVYLRELARLAAQMQSGALRESLAADEAGWLTTLRAEHPYVAPLPWELLQLRAAVLAQVGEGNWRTLLLLPSRLPQLVHALLQRDADGAVLELINLVPQPVEVVAIEGATPNARLPLVLAPAGAGERAAVVRVPLTVPAPARNQPPAAVRVRARIAGNLTEVATDALSYPAALASHPLAPPTLDATLRAFPFLVPSADDARHLVVKPGTWEVRGRIALPDGTALTIPAGTILRFARNAGIQLRGRLDVQGTADRPVRLEPVEANGTWQGIVVIGAAAKSTWTHATVLRTAGQDVPPWTLTAGVLFYGCELEFVDCRFEGNRCEDAINLVHCSYRLERVAITDCFSDAFDGDFGKGELVDCTFERTETGDALDVSGAVVTVRGARMRAIHDKAVSVGEASELAADRVDAEDVGTGLACKDGSQALLRNSTIRRARVYGVMVYEKKPSYGPAHAKIEGVRIEETLMPHVCRDDGSSLAIDGQPVPPGPLDVETLYQTGPMRKK